MSDFGPSPLRGAWRPWRIWQAFRDAIQIRTVGDVATEIAGGLQDGSIVLESDPWDLWIDLGGEG